MSAGVYDPVTHPQSYAIAHAQARVRESFPELSRRLPEDPQEAGDVAAHVLTHLGHPQAARAFVVAHRDPSRRASQVVFDRDTGDPGVALHPDRWDHGTLAHECAHHADIHAAGLDAHGAHGDEQHGGDFPEHYRRALEAVHPEAAALFAERHPQYLHNAGRIKELNQRFQRTAAADSVSIEHVPTDWGGRIFADHPTERSSMLEYSHGEGGTHYTAPTNHADALVAELHRHHPDARPREEHSAPEPAPEPTGPFFHGTTTPLRGYVRPATQHGRDVTFPSDTSHEHAYATSSESDAWNYAEKAWGAHSTGHPRVYEVAPTGEHEQDPRTRADGASRSNNASDRRSRQPWKVVRQVPMPEHMGRPRDWNPRARTGALDGPDWCGHRRGGRCFYPGDKLADGTRLGIPQDRGPCPWQTINQQAMCPISEPGPMAANFRTGARDTDPDFASVGPGQEWRSGLPEHHEDMVRRWEESPRDVGTGKARNDFRKMISTAPPIEGPVYRGDTPPKTYGYRSEIEKKVQPGSVINIPRWSSTTTRPEVAAGFGRVVYEIHGHNARGIGNTLHEGVMPPGKFQVHSAEWHEDHPSRAVVDGRTISRSPTLRVVLHPHEEHTERTSSLVVTAADWNAIRSEHQSVHRGFGMQLSDEDHEAVHDPSRPLHERAMHLARLALGGDHGPGREQESGMGTHWSTDANVAHHFAKQDARDVQKFDDSRDAAHGVGADGIERLRPETRVVVHAHFPEHEHIDPHAHTTGTYGYDEPNDEEGPRLYEREVPVKKGAPLQVHAISWGQASHRSDPEVAHDRETARYDFPESMSRKATRAKLSAKVASRMNPPREGSFGDDATIHLHNPFAAAEGEYDHAHDPCYWKDHKWSGGERRTLHPDHELHTTQEWWDPFDHEGGHYLRHPENYSTKADDDIPQVARIDGKDWIGHGHHRLLADRRLGRPTDVWYKDLDRPKREAARYDFPESMSRKAAKAGSVMTSWDHHPEYPETWNQDYRDYAKDTPHAAAVGQAQEHLRLAVPRYNLPLPADPDEASSSIQHMLRRAGHPAADKGFVIRHPDPKKGISCTVRDVDGGVGAALHPDRWDYGTLAHETAHITHQHELGVGSGAGLQDHELHGPGFVEHFKQHISNFGRGAAGELHDAYHSAVDRIQRHATAARDYPPRKHENSGVPFRRIFGPTYGLDHRLFRNERLRLPVRDDLMRKWHTFCAEQGLNNPDEWAIVYFSGSEASEWTGENREGNNDFDVLVGASAARFAQHHEPHTLGVETGNDEELAQALTTLMKAHLADPEYRLPGQTDGKPWDQTWFCNPRSYRITDIKPYAAYDVTHDQWAVKPPHLPGWSLKDFPEGAGLLDYCWGFEDMVRATLDMPEPYRHQEGFALWHFVHDNRNAAFGPQGQGWYDVPNVLEKWLDQKGLMAQLWTLMHQAVEDPHLLDSPADWTNTPVFAHLLSTHSSLRALASDLVYFEERSTPKVVADGESVDDHPDSYGKVTKREKADEQDQKTINNGDWVRKDEHGNRPDDSGYKKTRLRPSLVKNKD